MAKYKIKDLATDFGMSTKELSQVIEKFYEKPKSSSQSLEDDQLNVIFDYITQTNQIADISVVFAMAAAAPKKEEPKAAEPKAEQKAAPQADKPAQEKKADAPKAAAPAAKPEKPAKPAEPERKRERRVVDTSAVQVNTRRFDDVDNLVSERVQNYQGGKQKFGKKGQQKNQKQDNKFKGNKARNEEQEKLRRLQMEVARKAPVTVKIPEEITVGELASRMKKTAGEVI